MDKAQAVALLEKKLDLHSEINEVAELVEILENMPLAIVQAAAYISQRAPRCSVRQYIEGFKESDRKRTGLLDCDEDQLRRDWEAKNSIIVTWQLSFDYIERIRPSAADLLSLMCFFDRQGIPEALLCSRAEKEETWRGQKKSNYDEWGSNEEHDDVLRYSGKRENFELDVMILRNFCFITLDADGTTFGMHALVQFAARKWLEAKGQLERWKKQFISNLCLGFPTGERKNWAACQILFAQ